MFEMLVGAATIASGFAAVVTLVLVIINRLRGHPEARSDGLTEQGPGRDNAAGAFYLAVSKMTGECRL